MRDKEGNHISCSPLCKETRVGVGYANPGSLPAPSEAAEQHTASYTHSCRVQRTWRAEPSLQVSHKFVCIWSWNLPTDRLTHTLLSSFLVCVSTLSPLLYVLFSLPLFLSPPSSASLASLALSYVLRVWLVRRTGWDAADATAVWAPCLLQGLLKKTAHVLRNRTS